MLLRILLQIPFHLILSGFDTVGFSEAQEITLLQSKIHLTAEVKKHRCVCPHDCPDTCGMTVTVSQGRAVDLRGDKEHPFTKGFLCVKVNRYLEREERDIGVTSVQEYPTSAFK